MATPYQFPIHVSQELADAPATLAPSDLARIFRVSLPTINKAIADGLLPAPMRISARCRRWEKSAVIHHIQERGAANG